MNSSVLRHYRQNSVPLSAVVPGSAYVAKELLEVVFTYGIEQEDSSYTRLVRADMPDRWPCSFPSLKAKPVISTKLPIYFADLFCRSPLSTLFYQLQAVHLGELLQL